MTQAVGAHPGAVWRRVDLQCHTPRDRTWRGTEGIPGGSPEGDAARDAWADSFVAAARSKGLSVVAVTDHHDVALVRHVIASAERAGSDLLVFAGVEITCRDAVQCLALFDPSCGRREWDRLLAKLGEVEVAPDADAQAAPVVQCGLDLEDLLGVVADDRTLRDRVLIVPHFGPQSAHKSLNRQHFAARAKALACEGFYCECSFAELDDGTLGKIAGTVPEWGDRRRALVLTGDNKRSTWDRLGANECWMRLGEDTIEAVRQAFLADEARIAYRAPEAPTERIVALEVMSTLTGPQPVTIAFNDGFTALIGGRGSGKSSILEYLRYGLGRAEADVAPPEPDGRRRRDREARLIEQTLEGGWVRVSIEREGVLETWTRQAATRDRIDVGLPDGGTETLTLAAARQRFPARAFHQKELSTTMVDRDAAADNITGIAAADAIEERRRLDVEIVNARRAVTTGLQDVAAWWQAELERAQAASVVEDVKRHIAAVTQKLAGMGVKTEDLEVLAQQPRYDRARRYLSAVRERIADDLALLDEAAGKALLIDPIRYGALEFEDLFGLAARISEARRALGETFASGRGILEELRSTLEAAEGSFQGVADDFALRYAEAKERQAAHAALIAENERLRVQLREAVAQEDVSASREAVRRPAGARLAEARAELEALVASRLSVLGAAARRVGERSSGSLKAREDRDRRPAGYVEALCALLEGSRIRDPDVHCSDWVAHALSAGDGGWSSTCDALVELYRMKIMAGGAAEPGAEAEDRIARVLFDGRRQLTRPQIARVYANLDDRTVGAVLSATRRDGIVLTYVSEGRDIAFGEASPGQQASALLRLLLGQVAGTLVVDQPEDDLDNRVLMEIVDLVRTSKTKRQLIFATHNPNLVVNGDADKVVAMVANVAEDRLGPQAARIRVETDGSIETPAVREVITRLMEGGLRAFDLRARKYAMDKGV